MIKNYNPENDESFGADMLQEALDSAKNDCKIEEVLAVLNNNIAAMDRISHSQEELIRRYTNYIDTADKLVIQLNEIMHGEVPSSATKVVNENTKKLCIVLGKYVNDTIAESNRQFKTYLDQMDERIQKRISDGNDYAHIRWKHIYMAVMPIMGVLAFIFILLYLNISIWHNDTIYKIAFYTLGVPILLVSIGVYIYNRWRDR